MKNVGNSNRGRSQGVPNIFRAPIYRAHRAVTFATAQLSCIINHCKNRNRVMNFGTGSGYPVPATNDYMRLLDFVITRLILFGRPAAVLAEPAIPLCCVCLDPSAASRDAVCHWAAHTQRTTRSVLPQSRCSEA